MAERLLRPLRVWSAPSRRAATGRYWFWKCRLCDCATKDLFPLPGSAHNGALRHFEIMHAGADDA
jgi:hypothetical protein